MCVVLWVCPRFGCSLGSTPPPPDPFSHPGFRAAGASHDNQRTPKTCTFRPPKFHEKTPRERKLWREREKKNAAGQKKRKRDKISNRPLETQTGQKKTDTRDKKKRHRCVCVLVCGWCVVWWVCWCVCLGDRPLAGPPSAGPPSVGPPSAALGPPGFHTTAQELQTCTFPGPGASNTTKIPREDPRREREKKNENEGEGKKSAKIWAPSTLRPHVFQVWAPYPAPPPLHPALSDPCFFCPVCHFSFCPKCFFLSRLCCFCPECIFYFVPTTGCLLCPVSVFFCPDAFFFILIIIKIKIIIMVAISLFILHFSFFHFFLIFTFFTFFHFFLFIFSMFFIFFIFFIFSFFHYFFFFKIFHLFFIFSLF